MENMSYNLYLYNKRNELGLSIRKFAKLLNLSYWRYNLTEKGYLKPNKKVIANVSKQFDIDFNEYCTGYSSYPNELPYVRKHKVINKLYDFVGHLSFKILMGVAILLGAGSLIASSLISNYHNDNNKKITPQTIVTIRDYVYEHGSLSFSLTDTFIQHEIYNEAPDFLAVIKVNNKEEKYNDLNMYVHTWSEERRITYIYSAYSEDGYDLDVTISEYEESFVYTAFISVNKTLETVTVDYTQHGNKDEIINLVKEDALKFDLYIHDVIEMNMGLDLNVREDVFRNYKNIESKTTLYSLGELSLFLGGIVVALGGIFGLFFSFIYGTKQGVGIVFENRSGHFIPDNEKALTRSDIKITPFIPETILEIIGILFVFLSTLRILVAIVYISGYSLISTSDLQSVNNHFMSLFYFGMFLLYFVDFDLFLDDRRVIRNVVLYFLVFIGLYVIESSLIEGLKDSESILLTMFTSLKIPNMFGTISMYFLMMLFLFFTPKVVNTKARLIIYRSLAIIPIGIIIASTILFNGANTYFGWDLNTWGLYIFNSERIPFSILCILYLLCLFFLRLFFENRMGSEKAARFFNSNKFLWLKNIMTCLIIASVAIVEFVLKDNATANDFGIGHHYNLVWLIPLILFYHPHKGPRNKFVDYFTLGLYFLAIALVYIIITIPVIVGIFSSM